MISNRRRPDPLLLKCFSVSMSMIRAWLLMRGHIKASRDLANITYEDAEDAFYAIVEEAAASGTSEKRLQQILGAVQGGPKGPKSVIPTLQEAREALPITRKPLP